MGGRRPSSCSWLCRGETDRERLIDMEQRIRPLRTAAMGLLGLALLAAAPWLGWWTLLPLTGAAAAFTLLDRGLADAARPEYRMAAAWMLSEVAIAGSVALTGGLRSIAVAWLAIPVVTLSARFSARGVAAGLGFVLLLLLGIVAAQAGYAKAHPQSVIFPIALIGAVALLSLALMRSDLHHRSASIIDPLTSMLNRGALQNRAAELAQQAPVARQPVGVIVGDLDRFKSINDAHGHAAGDAVLRDVAYRLRKNLRAFDLAYRLGGEEFVVLLPGADARIAESAAEKLRAELAGAPCAGLLVTMSFGVSASAPGHFDFEEVFAEADRALYEGKAAGRNCVRAAAGAAIAPAEERALAVSV